MTTLLPFQRKGTCLRAALLLQERSPGQLRQGGLLSGLQLVGSLAPASLAASKEWGGRVLVRGLLTNPILGWWEEGKQHGLLWPGHCCSTWNGWLWEHCRATPQLRLGEAECVLASTTFCLPGSPLQNCGCRASQHMLQCGLFGTMTLALPCDAAHQPFGLSSMPGLASACSRKGKHQGDTDFAFEPFLTLCLPEAPQSLGCVSRHWWPRKHQSV